MKPLKEQRTVVKEQCTVACEKQEFSKYKPTFVNVRPCDLLIVIANASFTGNCKRLN